MDISNTVESPDESPNRNHLNDTKGVSLVHTLRLQIAVKRAIALVRQATLIALLMPPRTTRETMTQTRICRRR